MVKLVYATCRHCGHRFIPRVEYPRQCASCWGQWPLDGQGLEDLGSIKRINLSVEISKPIKGPSLAIALRELADRVQLSKRLHATDLTMTWVVASDKLTEVSG